MSANLSMKQKAKNALWILFPSLYNKLNKPRGQIFSIGIYEGDDPLSLRSVKGVTNPIISAKDITDVPANFVADPFMYRFNGQWYMFFEILNSITHKGQIGLAISDDGKTWKYNGTVLSESFHLAYPHIFTCDGRFFMIPDTPGNDVRLYEAIDFPFKWRFVKKILEGKSFGDSSIFEFQNTWWLFSSLASKTNKVRSLKLYYADSPLGQWKEHPSNPIIDASESISRPGGKVIMVNSKLYRFAQDGYPEYGSRVRAFEILTLSQLDYREQEVSLGNTLSAGNEQWNTNGMHHVDAHLLGDGGWIACVDGWHKAQFN